MSRKLRNKKMSLNLLEGLPAQHCHRLTWIVVDGEGYRLRDILPLCRANPQLQTLIYYCSGGCFTDNILIELIHTCPHLHRFMLPYETNITDTGILALSEHCPALDFLLINKCQKISEAAVLQLLKRCHELRLDVSYSSLSEKTWIQLDKDIQMRRC